MDLPSNRKPAKSKWKPIKFLQQILQNPSLKSQTTTTNYLDHSLQQKTSWFQYVNQVLHQYKDTQVILHICKEFLLQIAGIA